MSIDKKIRNNWYLEQEEIQTLITRYRIMKYLNILLAIILATLMVGCVSPTEPEPDNGFEPYKVGTWWVASPTQAEWEGVKTKTYHPTLQDTVVIDQPGQRHLTLVKDTARQGNNLVSFKMFFIDSAITNKNNISIQKSEFVPPNNSEAFFQYSSSQSINNDRYRAEIGLDYFCNRSSPDGFAIKLNLKKESGNFRVYSIKQNGFIDILNNHFTCQ